MTAIIIDGKAIASGLRDALKQEINKLDGKPGLAIIQVGDDPASSVYVEKKITACKDLGINAEKISLPASVSEHELIERMGELNARKDINGYIVQLPLPQGIDIEIVVNAIEPLKDVDCFHPENLGLLFRGQPRFTPATPKAIMRLLDHHSIPLEGKNVVVIGRSNLVGKPVAQLMMGRNATVTICHSRTEDIRSVTKQADVIVAAVGKPGLVKADMVKEGVVVIDVGTSRVDGKLKGDVDFETVKEKASYITPVPGGVGPMTVTMLIENVYEAFLFQNKL